MGFVNDLKQAVFGSDLTEGPSWQTRMQKAAYTPPSGLRITFDYTSTSKEVTKKTSVFNFCDANGSLVQDHGYTDPRFPLTIYFSGPDCDLQANVFEAALNEKGAGTLETPLYGKHTVIPFGDWVRNDDLVNARNQVSFDVTFYRTIDTVYPIADTDIVSAVLSALEAFGNAAQADFASSLSLGSAGEQRGVVDSARALTQSVQRKLNTVARAQKAVSDEFNDAVDTVNAILDTFVNTPLNLAFETNRMVQAPSRAITGIDARMRAYNTLAQDIFSSNNAISTPGGPGGKGFKFDSAPGEGHNAEVTNLFHTRDLFAKNFMAGAIRSVLYTANKDGGASSSADIRSLQKDADDTNVLGDNKFSTQDSAINAVNNLLDQYNELINWRDENFISMAGDSSDYISAPINTDTGISISELQKAVDLTAGYLIALSFSLRQRRVITLDYPRTILDVCAELYEDIDDSVLQFLIDSNSLSGSDIIELPKGKKIVYYV